ncbi:MAG: Phytoene dehydrogenase, partial [uncultured Friedmanniella sp.]
EHSTGHRRRHRRTGQRGPAGQARVRGDRAGEERAAGRAGQLLRGRWLPLRHGAVLVPDARRLRALLRPAGRAG